MVEEWKRPRNNNNNNNMSLLSEDLLQSLKYPVLYMNKEKEVANSSRLLLANVFQIYGMGGRSSHNAFTVSMNGCRCF